MSRAIVSRRATAVSLAIAASLALQLGAVIVHGLFDRLGPAGVSGLRFAFAAAILLAFVRPRLHGRTAREWLAIACFGVSMAGMNLFLYQALAHLPLGIAITIDFLGPFAVAVAGIRRRGHLIFPILGILGVALIVQPDGTWDPIGLLWAGLSAVMFAAYTLLSARVGNAGPGRGFDGLALAVTVAALASAPAALEASTRLEAGDVWPLALSAALGVCITYAADLQAIRLVGEHVVAVLFALDPVIAALLGAVLLREALDPSRVVGILLVAAAGAGALVSCRVGSAAASTSPSRPRRSALAAAQLSIAATIAASVAARNLLLLGDPQQLPQVSQGIHPEPVDTSALGWIADGHDVLPAEYGYFLAESRRMHPALAAPVSQLSYEGEL